MRKVAGVLITLIVLAAIGGTYWYLMLRPGNGATAAGGPGGPGGGPPPAAVVEASAAVRGTAVRRLRAIGTLVSNNAVIIRPEIAGRITEILFADGATVREGQPLIRLDRSTLQAELDDALATLTLARQQFTRASALTQRGAGTERGRDEAVAALHNSEARVALVRARLEKTTVVAPFSGTLGIRQVSIGDFVSAGQDIVNLEQMTPIKVEFRIPERFLTGLAVGRPVVLRSTAYPDTSFEAAVTAIDPRIDRISRSVLVQATSPNPEAKLRPGQFVSVTLRIDERRGAVFVPEQAVVPEGENRFVYRVIDGQAVKTQIATGMRIASQIEVLSGLAPGEVVITAGQQKIFFDHMPVTTTAPTYVPARGADEEIEAEAS